MKAYGPYELGIRHNGKLECVWEFWSNAEREAYILSITPPRPGYTYETHTRIY